jgi:hypothetical protein
MQTGPRNWGTKRNHTEAMYATMVEAMDKLCFAVNREPFVRSWCLRRTTKVTVRRQRAVASSPQYFAQEGGQRCDLSIASMSR